jgi:hypothetical protein
VETVFPFTAPTAERDIFEAVSFEEFWTWLLRHYLRPVHLNLARLHGMCDEQEQVRWWSAARTPRLPTTPATHHSTSLLDTTAAT